jgi:hypothetical protein
MYPSLNPALSYLHVALRAAMPKEIEIEVNEGFLGFRKQLIE